MIRINYDYVIGNDSYCWTLYEDKHTTTKRRRNQEPEPYYKPIGYYGTLNKALGALLDYNRRKVGQTLDCDLKTALETLRESDGNILECIKSALPDMEVIAREITE